MHCKNIDCCVNAFFAEIQLKRENLNSVFWAAESGLPNRYTGLSNDLNKSMPTTRSCVSNAFFNSASVLLNFYMNRASNVAKVLLKTYNHQYAKIHFIFSIFVSMTRPRFSYVVSMWSIFHFQPHFHRHYSHNLIKIDTLVFCTFLEYFVLFLDNYVDEEIE